MKLLIASAFCISLMPLSGAQTAHTKFTRNGTRSADIKPKHDVLPETTLDFKSVGDGLPLSAQAAFLGYPVCGADGTFYFNAIMLPKGDRQIIAVSPKDKGEVRTYNMASIMGLVNVMPHAMDAEGSDLYVLAEAAKSEDLLNHDVNPASKEVWRHTELFILHFHGDPSAPDVISLDLPFQAKQFAATSEGKFIFLGLDNTNQAPVLAVVDGSGELDHYIDAYQAFGTDGSLVANAPQRLQRQLQNMPPGAGLDMALTGAQFVHYRDSLLLLMPGTKPKVFTIRSGGALESTRLHLPAGLEADALVPSDNNWIVRVGDGTMRGKDVLIMVNPSDGKALRVIHSPRFGINGITCVHDGDYYGIRWPRGGKGDEKALLMEATE